VNFPVKHGGSFHSYVSLPEGILGFIWIPRTKAANSSGKAGLVSASTAVMRIFEQNQQSPVLRGVEGGCFILNLLG